MNIKVISGLVFLLITFQLSAQKNQGNTLPTLKIGRIYGRVMEASIQQPIGYASVTVTKRGADGRDSLIGGTLTLENGDFNITGLPTGMCKINVRFLGLKDWSKAVKIAPPNDLELDMGNINLEADSKMLNTVDIKAEQLSTTISLEKRVFNVDKNITSTGGTAEDVLKSVPSVTVDMDGNAKLRDRATTIYVDGKPSLMALNQIPSDQIESVEVITNPSAKYEASTTGGIVNIVLKKNQKPGYNGVIALGAGTQDRYNGMVNLNVHQGKWTVSGFYNFNTSNVPTKGYTHRINYNQEGEVLNYFDQNTDVSFKNVFNNGRVNIDYALNNRNTVSVSGNIGTGKFIIDPLQQYEYRAPDRSITSYGTRVTSPENTFVNNTVEGQWKKTFAKKDKSLVALANYGWGTVNNTAAWNTTGFDASGVALPGYPELVHIDGGNQNEQGLFQLDFVNPINDSTKMEMGVRSFWSARDQDYFYQPFDYETNNYVQDNQFSQDNRVTEHVNAAYITYSGQLKYKIRYQAGFRFEESAMLGKNRLEGGSDFGYNYPKGFGTDFLRSFFPSFYLAKKLDAGTEIGVNFSRKIQRPNPRQLMPGIQANDKQNIQMGNPDLEPEFVNLAELNFNKIFGSNNWLSTFYVSNETNTLKPLIRPSATDPTVLVTTFVNGTNELMIGFDNTLRLAFGKKLDVMLNGNVFNFKVAVDTFTNTGWAFNGKLNVTYRLPADFSVQINGGYDGNRPIPQGNRKGIAYLDFAVKKSFFNNAANITFSISDMFNSRKDITVFNQPTYYQEVMRRRDSRYFKLALQVPFGKADAAMFKRMKDAKRPAQEMPDFGG